MGFYTYFCKEIRSKTMPNKTLIKHLLHVKNIVIDSYKYCPEDDEFTLFAHPTKGQQCRCPGSNVQSTAYLQNMCHGHAIIHLSRGTLRIRLPG